jgi:PadR family transcriptional regulator PadR
MIGNTSSRLEAPAPSFRGALDIEPFRQELRRGCLALAALAELRAEQYGYTLRQSLKRQGLASNKARSIRCSSDSRLRGF